jgi:hypothetical protein
MSAVPLALTAALNVAAPVIATAPAVTFRWLDTLIPLTCGLV